MTEQLSQQTDTTEQSATPSGLATGEGGPVSRDDVTEALREILDGRWGHVRQAVRAQAGDAAQVVDEELTLDEAREKTLEQVKRLAATPYPAMGFTEAQGGTNDPGAAITSLETLGSADLSLFTKAGVQFGLFGGAIANLGTERHWKKYIRGMLDVSIPGCFAMTETGRGSDVQSLHTTATYDKATDELVINSPDPSARKDYIGNAAKHGVMAAVFAQLVVDGENHGVHCVLVPVRDENGAAMPGVEIGDCGLKAGLKGVDNGRFLFHDVRVPRENLLNRFGDIDENGVYSSPIEKRSRRFFTMLGTLVRGRITVGGAAAAAARTALVLAVNYGLRRRQFENPETNTEVLLMDYRVHQRRLLPLLAVSYAHMFAWNALAEEMDAIQRDPDAADEKAKRHLETDAAGLKAALTAHATRAIQVSREACGGAGYLSINRLGTLKADSDVFTTFEGDNVILQQLVAKGLLTSFSSDFSDMDTIETARFVVEQVYGQLAERFSGGSLVQRFLATMPGKDAIEALEERDAQIEFFADRAEHLLETVASRLRASMKGDKFEAFNSAQDHVLEAARAEIDRNVLLHFAAAIEKAPEGEAKDLLNLMCDLYAWWTIEENRAWYMEHDRITGDQSKQITRKVNELLGRVREHAQTYVDAFAIPEEWLTSDIHAAEDPVAASVQAD